MRRATKTKTTSASVQSLATIDLGDFVDSRMHKYAVETITERAIPDIVDGLKPVQRRLIYSASRIAHSKATRTAKLIGYCLGVFHPHGDASINDAMHTLITKQAHPTMSGTGNWGSLIDSPAAPRYNAALLSHYGRLFVDPDYLHDTVTAYVPTYDNEDKEPVVLPAPLPHVLLAGISGVAVGAATEIPAFTMESVVKMLVKILEGHKPTPTDFAKTLKMAFPNGGHLVSSPKNKQQWMQLFTSSKARIEYQAKVEVVEAKKQVIVSQWPPGAKPEAIMDKIRALPECGRVWNSKGSTTFIVPIKSGHSVQAFREFAQKVQSLCKSAISYNMNVTQRTAQLKDGVVDYDIKLLSMSVPKMFSTWLRSRLEIERRAIDYRIVKLQSAIDYTNLMLYATTILDIVRAAWEAPDFKKYIVQKTKCTSEQAAILAGFRLDALSKLSKRDLQQKLKAQQANMRQLHQWKKNPREKLLLDVKEAYAKASKKTAEVVLSVG